ncbi:MAG: hypothetical protein ACYCSN_13375 [Acidobacteriaceae bacterium]
MREQDGLQALQRLGGRTLAALDGTEYFCSQKLNCPQCLTRKRANGKTEHSHVMLAAMIVAPGHNMVLPLTPEFIAPQDGAGRQDCERNAAKRWLSAHGKRVQHLLPVYPGDALFSCQPLSEAVLATGARIFSSRARGTAARRCMGMWTEHRWTSATSGMERSAWLEPSPP